MKLETTPNLLLDYHYGDDSGLSGATPTYEFVYKYSLALVTELKSRLADKGYTQYSDDGRDWRRKSDATRFDLVNFEQIELQGTYKEPGGKTVSVTPGEALRVKVFNH